MIGFYMNVIPPTPLTIYFLSYLFLVLVIFRHRLAIPSAAAGAESHFGPGTHSHTEGPKEDIGIVPFVTTPLKGRFVVFSQ